MAVYESGEHHAVDFDNGSYRRFFARTHPSDALAVDEDGRIAEDFDLGHLAPAARARGTTTGHDLPRADEQRLQSRFSVMGRRI